MVTPSTEGEPAVVEIGKLPELGDALQVYVNGRQISLPKTAEVNGHRENEFYRIRSNDDIRIQNSYTVKEIAEFLDVPLGEDIKVNDTAARPDTRVYEHFTVSWNMEKALAQGTYVDLPDADIEEEAHREESVMQKAETAAGEAEKKQETQLPHPLTVIVNHSPITMRGKAQYVFVDVFDYIDFDLGTSASAGRSIVTNLNGRPAQYMEPLSEGDVIEIYWKNMR